MPNKTSAIEWLKISYHELSAAKVLYDARHYTDSIGTLLQQSIEKSLKSLLANENKKIIRSHDLIEVYSKVSNQINLDEDLEFLEMATEYYKEDRYPNPNYELPTYKEIKEVLDFAQKLFSRVCELLEIDKDEIIDAR
jgi:HEPN domain-containing protein